MEKYVTLTVNGVPRSVPYNTLLSDAMDMEKPCGGHGRCGKCKVKVKGEVSDVTPQEQRCLSYSELLSGFRMACLTYVLGDCDAYIGVSNGSEQIISEAPHVSEIRNPIFEKYGVSIDIGTTTIAARLYDDTGSILSEYCGINPQQKWGADVISRIEHALSGNERQLSASIREEIGRIIKELASLANIASETIDAVVITGNTVMLSLLADESVEPFSHAPFAPVRLFGEQFTASVLSIDSLSGDTPIYLPPCISAFVGADITCAILSCNLMSADCAMLVDIGTNGEIALVNEGQLIAASTAAGPAFEGAGIHMGMRAKDGAIDRVSVVNGALSIHTVGEKDPIGICGSGLVDSVAAMLELGVLDESGYLENDDYFLNSDVIIKQNDIRMVQLAKSAICAGLITLLKNSGVSIDELSKFYIAGGFGNYLNMDSAAAIGLFPRQLAEKAEAIGNSALAGASMILLDKSKFEEAREITKNAKAVDLAGNSCFTEHYIMGMIFSETECNGF